MTWVDRYHVALGAVSFAAGLAVVLADRCWPVLLSPRALALGGLAGAVLGGWGSARAWPWWLLAGASVLRGDDATPEDEHPLGPWSGLLAVAGLVGVWAAVPDTEPALAAAAVLLPVGASRALHQRPIGRSGSAALTVAVLGAVWVGSAGWGPALASACAVGALVAAPAVLGFGPPLRGRPLAWLAGAHLLVVLLVPRVVMRWPVSAAWAMASCSLVLVGAVAAVVATPMWRRRSDLRAR